MNLTGNHGLALWELAVCGEGEESEVFNWAATNEHNPSNLEPISFFAKKSIDKKFRNLTLDTVLKPWKVVGRYKWKRQEPMPVLEGRAALYAVKHALRDVNHFHKRHLLLSDSISAVCALDRGRGKSFRLRRVTQQVAALSLCSGCSFHYRWLPSEWNPSDAPSRGSRFPVPLSVLAAPMVIHRLIHLPSPQKKKSKQPRAKATRKPREKNSPVTWTGQSDKQRKIEVRKLQLKEAGSLIQASVGAACRKKYLDSWNRLKATTGLRDQRNMKASVLDQALCRMLNIMFSDGEDLSHAQYMLAASLFFNPHLKSSKQMALPLTKQTLQGWKKLDPPKARLPLPWEAVCGLVELSFLEGQREIGLMMLLCFCLYLRPGEVTRLRVQDLVPPVHGSGGGGAEWTAILHPLEEHIPSKTQEYDETVSFDKPWMRFIAEATYRHLNLSGRGKAEKIFSCSAQQMKKVHGEGFQQTGVGKFGKCTSIPASSRWGKSGLPAQDALPDRDPEERKVEVCCIGPKVRKRRKTQPTSAKPGAQGLDEAAVRYQKNRKNGPWPALKPGRSLTEKVFLEIFSGSGRLSKKGCTDYRLDGLTLGHLLGCRL